MFIGNSAVGLKPVPGAGFRQVQLFKTANHGLPRHAEKMREDDDMPARKPIRPRRQFMEFLHYAAGGRQERPAKRIGVTLLTGILDRKSTRLNSSHMSI